MPGRSMDVVIVLSCSKRRGLGSIQASSSLKVISLLCAHRDDPAAPSASGNVPCKGIRQSKSTDLPFISPNGGYKTHPGVRKDTQVGFMGFQRTTEHPELKGTHSGNTESSSCFPISEMGTHRITQLLKELQDNESNL